MDFPFPTNKQRVVVLGSTGAGKTAMGFWLLSYAPFHQIPYVIFDYKREELLTRIDRARQLALNEVPKYPGLYYVRPLPEIDDDRVSGYLFAAHRKRNIGLFFDEALAVPQHGGALQLVFTQGRSLHIPIIALSQRPVELNRCVFSEADYVCVFKLNDARDYQTVGKYVPRFRSETVEELPEHHSLYYRQKDRLLARVAPVPYETIAPRINARLPARIHFL